MPNKFISLLAAASILSAPTLAMAQAAPSAAPLSLASARAPAQVQDENQLDSTFAIIGIVVVAAVVLLIVLLDDDDGPSSP